MDAEDANQAKMLYQRGPIGGRKIALSSKAMQQMVGIDQPVAGAFFRDDIQKSPAQVNASDFRHLGLEAELAFEIARDVAPGDSINPMGGLIASVCPAFELIEDKDAEYAGIDVLTLVADNAWCGGVVLGDPIQNWQALDLANLQGRLHQDGVAPEITNTGAAHPLDSLARVLEHVISLGETVRAGELIITGSAVRSRFPEPGERLRYELDGLTAVELQIN
jgi:2-keto-4-pentenoate hydratase